MDLINDVGYGAMVITDGKHAAAGNVKTSVVVGTDVFNREADGITSYASADGAHVGYTATVDIAKVDVE